jgi:pimeloyl-ACP methyl ester carboxylesterase
MGRSRGERGDLETDVADLLALLDAVGSDRPYLVGAVIGGAIYAAFARTHPDRVAGLVWHGPFAHSARLPDYPWGATAEELEDYATSIAEDWGTEPFAAAFVAGGAPSMAGDEESVRLFAHWMRQTSDARTAAAYNRIWEGMDLRPWLGEVRVPTLITSRGADPGEAAHVASLIPGARLVTLEGADFMPFYDRGPVIAAMRGFIEQTRRDPAHGTGT